MTLQQKKRDALDQLADDIRNSVVETCCKVTALYCEDRALADRLCAKMRELKAGGAS